jgi:hypothetical protein
MNKNTFSFSVVFLLILLVSCSDKYKGYKEVSNKDGVIVLRNDDSVQVSIDNLKKDPVGIRVATNYQCLKNYNTLLVERVKATLPERDILGMKDFPLLIKMTTTGLLGLMAGTDTVLAVMGIENKEGIEKLTIGFCRYDEKTGKPDNLHITGYLHVDETWPAQSFTFYSPALSEEERNKMIEDRLPTGKDCPDSKK